MGHSPATLSSPENQIIPTGCEHYESIEYESGFEKFDEA